MYCKTVKAAMPNHSTEHVLLLEPKEWKIVVLYYLNLFYSELWKWICYAYDITCTTP